jgi:tRNA (guanine-N7-)-methyltransferase
VIAVEPPHGHVTESHRVTTADPRPGESGVLTYRRRGGRVGPELRRVLDELVPEFCLPSAPWNLAEVFPDHRDVVLEIGFGTGEATVAMAQAEPTTGIIAIEVHERGLGSIVREADRLGLRNVRVFGGDALDALRNYVPAAALAGIRAWFPDPWPKQRHHKRRLIQPDNVSLIASRLRPGGTLHVATDVAAYADVIAEVLANEPGLAPEVVRGPRPSWRPTTKYELAGMRAGRPPQDFLYRRV